MGAAACSASPREGGETTIDIASSRRKSRARGESGGTPGATGGSSPKLADPAAGSTDAADREDDEDVITGAEKKVGKASMLSMPKLKSARKMVYLQNSPMGLYFTDEQLHKIVHLVHIKNFAPGTWLYKQGDECDEVYIIGTGQIKLFIDPTPSSKRKVSDARRSFGSATTAPQALLAARAAAGASAGSPLLVGKPSAAMHTRTGSTDEKFEMALAAKTGLFSTIKGAGNVIGQELIMYKEQKRIASAKAIQTSECIVFLMTEVNEFVRTCEDKEVVRNFVNILGSKLPAILSGTKIFQDQVPDYILGNPVLWSMFRTRHLQKDEILFEQGSIGKAMYVIYDGEMTITLKGEGDSKNKQIVVPMKEKESFGEIGLLVDAPRSGTAAAASRCMLLELRTEEYNNLLKSFPRIASKVTEIARKHVVFNFRKYEIPFFESLTAEQFNMLGQLATIIQIPPGEIIFDINEYGDRFYMIAHGEVGIFVPKDDKKDDRSKLPATLDGDEDNGMVEVCRIGAGRYFGELALVTDSPRCATARSMTKCVILSITRHKFDLFFKDNPEALSDFQIKLAKYKISLSQLLAHPRGFQYFLQYCKTEYSSENCLFWKACSEFETAANKEGKTLTQELLDKIEAIAKAYIYDDSSNQVNLGWEIRQNLLKDLKEKNFSKTMFSPAKTAAFLLMERDSFNRFKSSPMFQEFLKEMEAYAHVSDDAVAPGKTIAPKETAIVSPASAEERAKKSSM